MDWFESWFNTPYYHILYKDRDFVEAENFIDKLLAEIRLPQHSTIMIGMRPWETLCIS